LHRNASRIIPKRTTIIVEYKNTKEKGKRHRKNNREVTSKKGTTAIEGNTFHTAMFQILLYDFWEITL